MDKNVQGHKQKSSSKRTFSDEHELNKVEKLILEGNIDQESEDGPSKKKRNSWIWNHFSWTMSLEYNGKY